jgi:hypothetical protein
MRKSVYLFILFLLLTLPIHTLHATPPDDKAEYQARIRNLELLLKSINDTSEKIAALQETLQSSRGLGREQELRSQINEVSLKLRDMEQTFDQLSTSVDLRVFQVEEKKRLDWNFELTELLGPVIKELKKVTSRPREIEKLRNKIELYKSQLPVTQKALRNLEAILAHATNPPLIENLKSTERIWESRHHEIRTQMNIAVQQLDKRLRQRKSLSQSLRGILQIFFKSRGRNLIAAFLAFVFIWFVLNWIHKLIQRYSPYHRKERSFYVRIFDMVYILLTVIVSLLALLAVLYFFGDWVLLPIAIIFILGIAWASKQAIPRFWGQAKLIMNFGPVREKERVIYNGLPYEVMSINLFTELVNRDLEGGHIRLPLKDLLELRSRPVSQNEPWFPSRCGDWIILNDGTHGKVIIQTPEIVELELLGGAPMTYRTVDYLSRSPVNLSCGFRLWITFGLDYAHQGIITQEIPALLEKAIIDGLAAEGHGDSINTIHVQFKGAGPSSLDIEIMADFKGNAGSKYRLFDRTIQGICVDTCNRHHWVIPFQQVRVHMARPSDHHA